MGRRAALLGAETPWLALAPRLSDGMAVGSLTRALAGVVALGVAAWAWRHRPSSFADVTWLAGVAFALWCVFESVIISYYAVPGVVLLVASVALRGDLRRALLGFAFAGGAEGVTLLRMDPWPFWLTAVALLAMTALATAPKPVPSAQKCGAVSAHMKCATR